MSRFVPEIPRRFDRVTLKTKPIKDLVPPEVFPPLDDLRERRRFARFNALTLNGTHTLFTSGPWAPRTNLSTAQVLFDLTPNELDDFGWRIYSTRTAPAVFADLTDADIAFPRERDSAGGLRWNQSVGQDFHRVTPLGDRVRSFPVFFTFVFRNFTGFPATVDVLITFKTEEQLPQT